MRAALRPHPRSPGRSAPHPLLPCRRTRLGLALLALALLAPLGPLAPPVAAQPPNAAPDSTLGWLVDHSTDIVRGRVVALESAWNPEHTQILTEVRVAVDEVLLGDAALVLTVVHPGGTVGEITQSSSHGAVFRLHEEVVVFAQPTPPGDELGQRTGALRLSSFAEGKLPLERDDEGGLWLARGVLQAVAPDAPLATDALDRVPWRDFAGHLRARIAGEPENGLHRRSAPSQDGLANVSAPASPVAGQALETESFHLIRTVAGVPTACPNEPAPFVHWDLREFPGCRVPYEIDAITDKPAAIAGLAFTNEVHAAAGKWNAVSPAHIDIFDNTQVSLCRVNNRDNRNCVGWHQAFAWGFNQIGNTTFWFGAGGRLLEADVSLNPNVPWQVTPNPIPNPCPVANGIQSTLIHEFGHFLGLDHPDDPGGPGCGNEDLNQVTKMFSASTGLCQVQLHQADKDGINYLYSHDLGDLPDPPYPTRVHQNVNSGVTLSGVDLKVPNDGPSHLYGIYQDPDPDVANFPRYQYEWLAFKDGAIDDHPQECEARPVDNFDDGVTYSYKCVNGVIQGAVTAAISVKTSADVRGRTHPYGMNQRMYLNGWFDWNGDGDFADVLEYGIGAGANSVGIIAAGTYAFRVLPPPNTPCSFASRIRLDYREDVGQTLRIDPTLVRERGAAQHGEVEDYLTPPQFPVPVYCHPQELPTFFPDSGRTVSLMHLCHPPEPTSVTSVPAPAMFQPAGGECMHSTMTVGMDIDFDGVADEVVGLTGDVCVQRSDPYVGFDGLRRIDTEMVLLDMFGTSDLAGDLHLGLAGPTLGQIRQSPEAAALGFDISGEQPASSYFDVHFVIETALYGPSEPTLARVEGEIGEVPPGEVVEVLPPVEGPPAGEEPPPPDEEPLPEEEPVFSGS